MTNEISSQITSTVLQSRATESVNQSTLSSNVNERQESAVNGNTEPETITSNVKSEPARAELEQAVSDINDYVQTVNREIQFRVDDALPLGRSIVTVINTDTQETIREFPTEQALALAQQLREQAAEELDPKFDGLIISARA